MPAKEERFLEIMHNGCARKKANNEYNSGIITNEAFLGWLFTLRRNITLCDQDTLIEQSLTLIQLSRNTNIL